MQKPSNSFFRQNWFSIFWIVVGVLLILGMVYLLITVKTPTPLETGLMTLILTASSTAISYLATKIYAELTYTQTLRDHGVQIARGIMELKGQMEKLADWVTQKRLELSEAETSSNNATEAAFEHVELTLQGFQGMAANAVGGIAGVIGDAFAQYEEFLDQVSKIREEASERTSQIEEKMQNAASANDLQKLQTEIEKIRNQTEQKISELAKTSALPIPAMLQKRSFTERCPSCGGLTAFEMPDRVGETRVVVCKNCGTGFNAHLVSPLRVLTRSLGIHLRTAPRMSATAAAIESVLRATHAWVAPEALELLLAAAVRSHQNLKKGGQEPSASKLQETVFAETEDATSPISKVTVRHFFKLLFFGRAFRFADSVEPRFKAPYSNEVDETALRVAFVGQCMYNY